MYWARQHSCYIKGYFPHTDFKRKYWRKYSHRGWPFLSVNTNNSEDGAFSSVFDSLSLSPACVFTFRFLFRPVIPHFYSSGALILTIIVAVIKHNASCLPGLWLGSRPLLDLWIKKPFNYTCPAWRVCFWVMLSLNNSSDFLSKRGHFFCRYKCLILMLRSHRKQSEFSPLVTRASLIAGLFTCVTWASNANKQPE